MEAIRRIAFRDTCHPTQWFTSNAITPRMIRIYQVTKVSKSIAREVKSASSRLPFSDSSARTSSLDILVACTKFCRLRRPSLTFSQHQLSGLCVQQQLYFTITLSGYPTHFFSCVTLHSSISSVYYPAVRESVMVEASFLPIVT